jgi:hypothetical protein
VGVVERIQLLGSSFMYGKPLFWRLNGHRAFRSSFVSNPRTLVDEMTRPHVVVSPSSVVNLIVLAPTVNGTGTVATYI